VLNDGGLFNSGPDFSTALRSARNDTGVWNGDKCSISTKDDPPNKFEGLNLNDNARRRRGRIKKKPLAVQGVNNPAQRTG